MTTAKEVTFDSTGVWVLGSSNPIPANVQDAIVTLANYTKFLRQLTLDLEAKDVDLEGSIASHYQEMLDRSMEHDYRLMQLESQVQELQMEIDSLKAQP